MKAGWTVGLAAAALAAAGGANGGARAAGAVGALAVGASGTCELSRMDRARTPSTACMQCHDGSAGPAVPYEMKAGGGGMSHPVGVDYAAAAARAPGRYQPESALPRDVPLVGGRIECTTCHDGSLTTPKQVVEQSRLCYACHRL
jgi:predicted CXXCH cytochrome family protein